MGRSKSTKVEKEANWWFEQLVDNCQKLKYGAETDYIRSFHLLGSRVNKDILKFEKPEYGNHTIEELEKRAGFYKNFLYMPMQFAKKYPDVEEAILGRGLKSWRNVRTLLPNKTKESRNKWLRIFDVWNFSKINDKFGRDYPGRIPYEIIANTLHYFTNEGDLVVDPMAGGGTTIDVCKMMKRVCIAYDINPSRRDIRKHDMNKGWPPEAKSADLIFWDPPYFKKKEKEYGENSISAVTSQEYLDKFEEWIKSAPNTKIAFLMSNFIDYNEPTESIFSADYYKMFREAGFTAFYEIQCPLSTQQYQVFDVVRAKEKKQLLIISRSLMIYEKV